MKHNRILVFSTDDHLYPAGGAEQAFGNITERLPHIEFDLICGKLRKGALPYEKVKNVNIHRMGVGIPKLDGIILALFGHFCAYRLMKTRQYDLIWSIMASYGAFSAVRVRIQRGIPFLLTLQEGDSFDYIYKKVRHVRKSFNKIFEMADGVQAISSYLLRWAREMGYRGSMGVLVPNGVDLKLFDTEYSDEEVKEKRKSFGFKEGAFILVTSSRLERKNAIEDVIEALETLPPHVCFVICGSGSLLTLIEEKIARLGLAERVRLLGFKDPKELPLILRATDAFIRPSVSEGLGTAFLEAMSVRIPIIATTAGGIADFLIDGETGFVVRIHNIEDIRNTILRVMNLTELERNRVINQSERLVREKYDWKLVAQEMERIFKDLSS